MPVEHLDQSGKVHQGSRKPVDLVNSDDVDQASLDVGQQPAQSRPLQVAAGEPAIVVAVADQDPPLGALAGDIRLARLTLGVERVESLVEALFARLPGVDGAAQLARDGRDRGGRGAAGHALPRAVFSPKNTSPFQRVPVMARAMADSDLKGRP